MQQRYQPKNMWFVNVTSLDPALHLSHTKMLGRILSMESWLFKTRVPDDLVYEIFPTKLVIGMVMKPIEYWMVKSRILISWLIIIPI